MLASASEEEIKLSLTVDPEMEEMMKAGLHLGHLRSKRNPGMIPFIWGVRNNIDIIDLAHTREKLDAALAFLKQAANEMKIFLVVGTRPSAKELVKKTAGELGTAWVTNRWIGGTITNFKVITKRIEKLEEMEQDKAGGGFDKYTKREQMDKEAELARLGQNFEGLRCLKKLPDVVVIIDTAHDALALREAKRMGLSVVAVVDTNADPRMVQYPIPANNDARSAVNYVLERVKAAIAEGYKEAEQKAATEASSGNGKAA